MMQKVSIGVGVLALMLVSTVAVFAASPLPDFTSEVTSALTGVTDEFGTAVVAVAAVTFLIAAIAMIYRRVRGLIAR